MCDMLVAMQRTLYWKRLLGLCPFAIGTHGTHCTDGVTCYALVHIHCWLIVFPTLIYTSYGASIPSSYRIQPNSVTRHFVTLVQQINTCVVLLLILAMSLRQRHRHARLMNRVAALHDHLQARLPAVERCNLARRQFCNWLYLLVYWLCPCSSALVQWDAKLFDLGAMLFCGLKYGAMMMLQLADVHVQELVVLMTDCLRCCCLATGERLQSECLSDVLEVWHELGECFGWQLVCMSMICCGWPLSRIR